METTRGGITDVHTRPLTHMLQIGQVLQLGGTVVLLFAYRVSFICTHLWINFSYFEFDILDFVLWQLSLHRHQQVFLFETYEHRNFHTSL